MITASYVSTHLKRNLSYWFRKRSDNDYRNVFVDFERTSYCMELPLRDHYSNSLRNEIRGEISSKAYTIHHFRAGIQISISEMI